MERFPLIGYDKGLENVVFRVQTVNPYPATLPISALSLLSPTTLHCSEVYYSCFPLTNPYLRIYFHTCVFSTLTNAMVCPVTVGLFYQDNPFSEKIIEILGDKIGRNGLGTEFNLSLEAADTAYKFSDDPAYIRVNLGLPIVVFTSLLCFEAESRQYQFLTRHVLVLAPYSPLTASLQSADLTAFQGFLMGLQEAVINPHAFYGYIDYWVEKVSQYLIGASVPSMTTSLLRELLYFLVWSLDDKPQGQDDYGKSTYERICRNHAENDDNEAIRLRLVTIWTTAIRFIQEYYLLS